VESISYRALPLAAMAGSGFKVPLVSIPLFFVSGTLIVITGHVAYRRVGCA
jgi:hypothetical protein